MPQAIVRWIKSHRPSPAMMVSLVALFVALGGTSYAALKLPRNSVGSAQVINGSLQTADLSKKTAAALKGKSVRGPAGPQGPQGAQGPAGATGPAGKDGTNATINGVASGGDLAGTYPNPTIKDGAITTSKFGAAALAPDANLLDGIDSTGFLGVNDKAADADRLDGLNSTAFLGVAAKAADSNLLDGIDSTGFLGVAAKAADSNLLDGIDSTGFLGVAAKAADANLLDGTDSASLVLHCPSNTSRAGDVCFDTAKQPAANWSTAWLNCVNRGMRLPSPGEEGEIILLGLGGGTATPEVNWTDDHFAAGSSYAISFASAVVGFEQHPDSDAISYRCITSPRNNTGPTPTGPTFASKSTGSSAIQLKSH